MTLISQLDSIRKKVKTVEVETNKLGKVTLMALFTRHRLEFHKLSENHRDPILLMVAMSVCENGRRLVDSLDIDEVMDMLDPLGSTAEGLEDIHSLYESANDLSKVTVDDVEEAAKN
ncbi:hypothetical protein ACFO4O_04355 [Glaciecola siphonariae]|uniref:Phage tail protein n=1 Tax=Glaciecola siphonariae TaxID=521012 RepID=A0ABV9LSY5_9ALTE